MSFKKFTVGKKLWILSAVNAFLLCAIVTYNFATVKTLNSELHQLGEVALPVVRNMTLADMMHDGLRAVVLRSILASEKNNEEDLAESKKEYIEFAQNIEKYLSEIKNNETNSEIKNLVTKAQADVKDYVNSGSEILLLTLKHKPEMAYANLASYQKTFEALEESLGKLGDKIEEASQAQVQASVLDAKKAQTYTIIMGFIGLIIGIFLSALVNFDLIKTLRGMVLKLSEQGSALSRYTTEIDASSQSLSTSSQQQASAVQETASAIEEISSMVDKTTENTKQLADSSEKGFETVRQGQDSIQDVLAQMEEIKRSNLTATQQIELGNEQIKKIVEVIGNIGEKTKVINDIVFQTKLLSFNASVEAARAGEHGKGFAVVAEEVGNLAVLSGKSAQEITQMLEAGILEVNEIIKANSNGISKSMQESSKKVEEGKKAADECGKIFAKIVDQVGEVSRLSNEISNAAEEQKTGMVEIKNAIQLFSASTDSNSATAGKSAGISKQLQSSFSELSMMMEELREMVNGRAQDAMRTPQENKKNIVPMGKNVAAQKKAA